MPSTKRLLGAICALVLGTATEISADYSWEVCEVYPGQVDYPSYDQQNAHHQLDQQALLKQQQQASLQQQQNHQQHQGYQQVQPTYNQVTQQTRPSLSVSEAAWVCTNTKTNDVMIISSEDGPVPNRVNSQGQGQGQWQRYPQPQPQQPAINQPTYPQRQPIYQPQPQPQPQPNYPQTQATVTQKPITTTTEDPYRPIWSDDNSNDRPSYPQVTTTTRKPVVLMTTQKSINPLWPDGGSGNKPGFTVIEPTSTTKGPTIDDDDDDAPLNIVIGK